MPYSPPPRSRRVPDQRRVHGAPVASSFQLGFIALEGVQGPSVFLEALRPWGDDEIWVIIMDGLYGRIAIPVALAIQIGAVDPEVVTALAKTPDVIAGELRDKAASETASVEDEARFRATLGDFVTDLGHSAGQVTGTIIGGAAQVGAKILGGVTGGIISATPLIGWVVIGGAVLGAAVYLRRR